jgi:hypothetical protein
MAADGTRCGCASVKRAGLYHRRVADPVVVARSPRRWPFGLLVVAGLRMVDAVVLTAIGLGIREVPLSGLPVVAANLELTRAIELTLAVATVVGVVGLLLLRRWGWTITILLVGLELLGYLIRFALGVGDSLGLGLLVITAFYLNQRSVRVLASGYLGDPGSSHQ